MLGWRSLAAARASRLKRSSSSRARVVGAHHLERHSSAQLDVERLVDDAHSALAEDPDQLVGAHPLAGAPPGEGRVSSTSTPSGTSSADRERVLGPIDLAVIAQRLEPRRTRRRSRCRCGSRPGSRSSRRAGLPPGQPSRRLPQRGQRGSAKCPGTLTSTRHAGQERTTGSDLAMPASFCTADGPGRLSRELRLDPGPATLRPHGAPPRCRSWSWSRSAAARWPSGWPASSDRTGSRALRELPARARGWPAA